MPDTTSIKDQLKNSSHILSAMDAVTIADAVHVDTSVHGWKRKLKQSVSDYYSKINYTVMRKGFGNISISHKDIDRAISYINNEGEAVALYVVHDVIKNGVVIDVHIDHKKRGFDTITFGAPVVLSGVRGNMAVVVKTNGKNRYKAHRIITLDGKPFFVTQHKK